MLVDVGDTRLHVEERGAGDLALVALHGGPGLDHTMFGSWLDPEGDLYRLLLVDERAQGRSDPAPPGTWTLDLRGFAYNAGGILAFSLDGTAITAAPYNASAATVDTYSASPLQFFQTEVCHDLTITTGGVYTLRATVTGKNASSSGFATNVLFVYLSRTG